MRLRRPARRDKAVATVVRAQVTVGSSRTPRRRQRQGNAERARERRPLGAGGERSLLFLHPNEGLLSDFKELTGRLCKLLTLAYFLFKGFTRTKNGHFRRWNF